MWRVSTIVATHFVRPMLATGVAAAARRRGIVVHDIAEAYAHGAVMPGGLDAYTDGLSLWFMEYGPAVLFTERRIVSEQLHLTGRVDLGAILCGRAMPDTPTPWVIDYKTGQPADWHGIQTAGYKLLVEHDVATQTLAAGAFEPKAVPGAGWSRAVLYLPGNGKYRFVPQTDPQDTYLFRAALTLHTWRLTHGLDPRTDPEYPTDDLAGAVSESVDGGADPDDQFF